MSVLLPGLDGSNPLGFLAALGVLRVMAGGPAGESVLMRWVPHGSTWMPELISSSDDFEQEAILDVLHGRLSMNFAKYPSRLLRSLAAGEESRRRLFDKLASRAHYQGRLLSDWIAALSSDMAPPEANNQLQTVRRDYYLGNLTSVIERTAEEHLRRALFSPWDYADMLDNQSLHLDPSEDRRHAYQWYQPSGDPNRKRTGGMLGANRLAIEAIPLFTSFPEKGALRTVGFTGNRSTNTRWTWPIWNVALPLAVVRSLLLLPELQDDPIAAAKISCLRAMGLVAIHRTDRILIGKTPNFTPARSLM